MEKQPPRPMTPFDELVVPRQLQMLKLFLPYTPSSNQQFLGVFVKFLELKETMAFFQNCGNNLHTQAFSRSSPPTAMEMLQEIKPYMPPKEAEMMDTFSNMMNIMEMVQMFQGSGADAGGSPFGDMADIFSAFGGGFGGAGGENPENGSSENTDTGSGGGFGGMGNASDMFSGGFNPMDMMMGMMTPDQQNMFQMYNHMFENQMGSNDGSTDEGQPEANSSETASSEIEVPEDVNDHTTIYTNPDGTKDSFFWKGDDTDERMDESSGNEEYRPG